MSTTTLADARNALASGDRSIGALVYWKDLSKVRIERGLVRTGFRQAGCGDAIGRDPKPEALLNQSATVHTRRQGKKKSARSQVKLKGKSDTFAVYAVLMRRDQGDLVRYLEEARLGVARTTMSPVVVEVENDAPADEERDLLIQSVVDTYNDLRDYIHGEELSSALMRAMKTVSGISIRTGVYFVPASSVDNVKLLKAFVEENSDAHLTCWDIRANDGDENATEAKTEVRQSFIQRLSELTAEVEDFTSTIVESEDVLAKSINARVKRFRELDAEVQLFTDILGDHRDELTAAITAAKVRLLGSYLGSEDSSKTEPNVNTEAA